MIELSQASAAHRGRCNALNAAKAQPIGRALAVSPVVLD